MSYPPPQPPYGQQPPYGYGYMKVKERGFNPVTFGVHACLWFFVHWWIALFTFGLWLFVAIPVSFIGWRVTRTVPIPPPPPGPYPPQHPR